MHKNNCCRKGNKTDDDEEESSNQLAEYARQVTVPNVFKGKHETIIFQD